MPSPAVTSHAVMPWFKASSFSTARTLRCFCPRHCLHHAFEEGKEKEIAEMLTTPEIQELRKKLYQKAKQYAVKATGRR
ncbi:MAG: hypothetical protein NT178_13790 [Proteobacteria bacterium]|nr:hypothetical protein [Pseudomonadota bacterium]